EQVVRERVDGREQGRRDRGQTEEEQRRAPEGPSPRSRARDVERAGRHQRDRYKGRRTVLSTMIATKRSARYRSEYTYALRARARRRRSPERTRRTAYHRKSAPRISAATRQSGPAARTTNRRMLSGTSAAAY